MNKPSGENLSCVLHQANENHFPFPITHFCTFIRTQNQILKTFFFQKFWSELYYWILLEQFIHFISYCIVLYFMIECMFNKFKCYKKHQWLRTLQLNIIRCDVADLLPHSYLHVFCLWKIVSRSLDTKQLLRILRIKWCLIAKNLFIKIKCW